MRGCAGDRGKYTTLMTRWDGNNSASIVGLRRRNGPNAKRSGLRRPGEFGVVFQVELAGGKSPGGDFGFVEHLTVGDGHVEDGGDAGDVVEVAGSAFLDLVIGRRDGVDGGALGGAAHG